MAQIFACMKTFFITVWVITLNMTDFFRCLGNYKTDMIPQRNKSSVEVVRTTVITGDTGISKQIL